VLLVSSTPRSRTRTVAASDVQDLVTAVLTASRVLVGVAVRSLAELEDTVTVPQFRTLVVLDTHGQMNLNTLSGLLDVTPSTALRMIDRLLVSALVTRRDNPANRREVLLELTDEGKFLVEQVTAKRRAEITQIVTGMPASQRTEGFRRRRRRTRGPRGAARQPRLVNPPARAMSPVPGRRGGC
jgi:DNA-binding MarR family transcriptional regulator